MTNLPNAVVEGVPEIHQPAPQKDSTAMKVLERVTNKIPDSIPVTRKPETQLKPPVPLADEKPIEKAPPPPTEDFDIGEPTPELDDIDKVVDIKGTSAENMKRLRTKLKSTHQELQNHRAEVETLRKKVTDYESGVVIPDQLQELQRRVDELEPLEKVYKLETSPAYQEAITKPLDSVREKLIGLANDYGVDLTVLDKAISATNRAEINGILNSAFPDEVGALEAKSLINSMKELGQKAQDFKKDASASLGRLHKQSQEAILQRRQKEVEGISSVAKSAWVESLTALREEDHPFLSFKDGDSEHNETIARPILNKASRDYGAVVRALGENGLQQMPPDISFVLARSIQLSHESAILKQQNQQLTDELITLRKRVGNLNSLNRPSANGGGTQTPSLSTGREAGGVGAARAALARATQNK